MPRTFQQALQDNILQDVASYPKSDLHSHAGRGGNVKYISKWSGKKIALPPHKFQSLAHMHQWYLDNIKSITSGVEGQLKRWEAGFRQAFDDNITVLALSFETSEIASVGGMETFVNILTEFNQIYAPDTIFLPELTFDRACDVNSALNEIDYILSYDYFKSIDICCDMELVINI